MRPLPYSQIPAALAADPPFDLATLQVTPPDAAGCASSGRCADFARPDLAAGASVAGVRQPGLPRPAGGRRSRSRAPRRVRRGGRPYITGREAAPGAQLTRSPNASPRCARRRAIQTGIGGAPAAAVARLMGRRGLVVRSGMVTEGYRALAGPERCGRRPAMHGPGAGQPRISGLGRRAA